MSRSLHENKRDADVGTLYHHPTTASLSLSPLLSKIELVANVR